jgi:hypothetical protein
LLGQENRHLEKLISRGACISWSPKNLASALVMFALRWMVKNTEFRYFTAYSDVEARELGTIYQACNFIYLGQASGARFEYFDPKKPALGYFSDRLFRRASFIKRKTIEGGIQWNSDWQLRDKLIWSRIPDATEAQIKELINAYQESCTRREVPPKHKYVYILGKTKAETKQLKAVFSKLNPEKIALTYPKLRGPIELSPNDQVAQNTLARPCRISDQELTKRPDPCWPKANDNQVVVKKFYSIKEVTSMYGISSWLIYHHIKTDPTFPVVNVGIKKRFLIDPLRFEAWLEIKTKRFQQAEHNLISSDELLRYK